MIRNLALLILLLSVKANAQTNKSVDSLFLIKNYLLDIKETVNTKKSTREKIAKLDSLILMATNQKAIFERNLSYTTKYKREVTNMKASLNFILQSMVLYKTDLKNNGKSSSEALYLNKNIPILADKIYYYSKLFVTKFK